MDSLPTTRTAMLLSAALGLGFLGGCRKDNPVYGFTESGAASGSSTSSGTSSSSTTGSTTSTVATSSDSASTSASEGSSTGNGVGPAEDLVVWYRFSEGEQTGLIEDHGPLGLDATCMACMDYTDGPFGRAALFDGTDVDLATPVDPVFELSEFTLATWVRLDEPPPVGSFTHLLGKQLGDEDDNSYELWFTNNSGAVSLLFTIQSLAFTADTSVSFDENLGSWTHVAATFDGQATALYINGIQVGAQDVLEIGYDASPVSIGHDRNGLDFLDAFMVGAIDEVRIYSAVLTATEIGELAQSP